MLWSLSHTDLWPPATSPPRLVPLTGRPRIAGFPELGRAESEEHINDLGSPMRKQLLLAIAAGALTLGSPPVATADTPASCEDAYCTPGISGGVVLGAPCGDTSYFVFGTTSWGRLVFCGSPRRYEPRYFRSPPMRGIKVEGSPCPQFVNDVAQAPDGLFLSCVAIDGATRWVRGDQ